MIKNNSNILELDVEKLFEERSIDYIVEIEKLLDGEIERKRNELRSMVGERYKDVLAASDAIKCMKKTSQEIVSSIEKITKTCEALIENPIPVDLKSNLPFNKHKCEENTVIIQLRLAIFMNEQIWIALDEENNLNAAQYYLLAQHIHTGLSLSPREFLSKVPILHRLKSNLSILRSKIFEKITEKLESVELTSEETSGNLNALMLLENQNTNDLLNIFIQHRKTALNTVINVPYSSVRAQINSMVRCLVTTIRLLHECFIGVKNSRKGLIWQQLEEICSDTCPPTLSRLKLPVTPLTTYIPEIIKQFRPKCKFDAVEHLQSAENVIKSWLESTQESVGEGLEKFLRLITNIRGLHLTREEALKIKPPDNWSQICKELHLPDNFDIWYHFFQHIVTARCKDLISKKVKGNLHEAQRSIVDVLDNFKSDNVDTELGGYAWTEEASDVSKTENVHKGLSMKTRGFSKDVVSLCEKMDSKYLELLEDVSQYLYGEDYGSPNNFSGVAKDYKFKRKYIDKIEIENHIHSETVTNSLQIPVFIKSVLDKHTDHLVFKSIVCARYLQGILLLCHHFNRCGTLNGATDDWLKISEQFNKTSHLLWHNWVGCVLEGTRQGCERLTDFSPRNLVRMMMKWDEIEIQEQTEEKVFKSQIRVPLKASTALHDILKKLNDNLSQVLPHTLPKLIHLQFIEENCEVILDGYRTLLGAKLNQKHSLQFLFDVKFLTTLCISRENVKLIGRSQEVCDKLRSKIDPFDLDVFYPYLQNNVKRAVVQSQMIFGCLLPSSAQLDNLGLSEKSKEQEQNPSVLEVSTPSNSAWFPLLPIMVPFQRSTGLAPKQISKDNLQKQDRSTSKKPQDPASIMKQSAASLFSGLTTDWFS